MVSKQELAHALSVQGNQLRVLAARNLQLTQWLADFTGRIDTLEGEVNRLWGALDRHERINRHGQRPEPLADAGRMKPQHAGANVRASDAHD